MIEMPEMHGNNELGKLISIPLFRGQHHRPHTPLPPHFIDYITKDRHLPGIGPRLLIVKG